MRKCAVPDCREHVKNSEISLHRFPLQKSILLKDWLAAIKAKDFRPGGNSFLCSKHFKSEDFEKSATKQKRLKPHAVPSLYLHPPATDKRKSRNQKDSKLLATMKANIWLDHNYTIGSCPDNELPDGINNPSDFYSMNQDTSGMCEFVNPWQSRVIEACFLVPVICDLGEDT